LELSDPWVVDVVLATVIANMLDGDPLWLLLVNPASTGKTELVQLFHAMPDCGWLPEITENTFLSGLQRSSTAGVQVPAPDRSLLFRWTDPALRKGVPPVRVMLVQDLTGLITQRRERRDTIFGQLRQIYDGRFVKATGMGDDLIWQGYLGLLGGVTPHYDDVAEINSVLGERFLLYRPARVDPLAEAQCAAAVDHDIEGHRLSAARVACDIVRDFQKNVSDIRLPSSVKSTVAVLATLIAQCRTPVSRDSYTRVMRTIPEPEGPARLTRQLSKLLVGLAVARGLVIPGQPELQTVAKTARDSMPAVRLRLLQMLRLLGASDNTTLADHVRMPRPTVRYVLEDLHAIGIVSKTTVKGRDVWDLAPTFRSNSMATGFMA
jgi:hypothetical protein